MWAYKIRQIKSRKSCQSMHYNVKSNKSVWEHDTECVRAWHRVWSEAAVSGDSVAGSSAAGADMWPGNWQESNSKHAETGRTAGLLSAECLLSLPLGSHENY